MQSTRARRHCAVAFLVEQNMVTRHNRCTDVQMHVQGGLKLMAGHDTRRHAACSSVQQRHRCTAVKDRGGWHACSSACRPALGGILLCWISISTKHPRKIGFVLYGRARLPNTGADRWWTDVLACVRPGSAGRGSRAPSGSSCGRVHISLSMHMESTGLVRMCHALRLTPGYQRID